MKRPFITLGMLAFLLLIPLAFTSTKKMMKRLGKRWKSLHKLIYGIAILGVLHFLLLVKADLREPIIYGLILSFLFLVRFKPALLIRFSTKPGWYVQYAMVFTLNALIITFSWLIYPSLRLSQYYFYIFWFITDWFYCVNFYSYL